MIVRARSDTYNDVCSKERDLESIDLRSVDGNKPTFDFLIIHSGAAGTTAVQNFLALHPNLILAQKSEMDDVITYGQEESLARTYQAKALSSSTPVRAGMVQHGYIAGREEPPKFTDAHSGYDIVEQLAKNTCREVFYHLVRHPLENLRSTYNNRIINHFAGGYKFPGAINYPTSARLPYGPSVSWPSSWSIPSRGMPKRWVDQYVRRKKTIDLNSSFSISKAEHDLVAEFCFGRTKYAAVGKAYRRCFENWVPIDAADFMPGNSLNGIEDIFKRIGVNSKYKHPVYDTLAASPARRAMLSNIINLTDLDHPLYVHLDYAGQALYSYAFPLVELATLEPNDHWPLAEFAKQPVSLVVNYEQWVLQSPETRKRLLGDGLLQFILEQVAIPAWIDCYKAWNISVSDHLVDDWTQIPENQGRDVGTVKSHISDDIEGFLIQHPDFYQKWDDIEKIL